MEQFLSIHIYLKLIMHERSVEKKEGLIITSADIVFIILISCLNHQAVNIIQTNCAAFILFSFP
jgi:hypothetical protein